MGLTYRRRKRLNDDTWMTYGTGGASLSRRIGPLTVNTRGRVTLRLAKGLTWRKRLW